MEVRQLYSINTIKPENILPQQSGRVEIHNRNACDQVSMPDNVSFTGLLSGSKELLKKGFFESLKLADKNAALFKAVAGAIIAVFLRPIGIFAVPGAKKEDKQYAAVKSGVSAIIGTTLFATIFYPLGKKIENLAKNHEIAKFPFKFGSKSYDIFNYLATMGTHFLIVPFSAFIVVKAVQEVVDFLFPTTGKPNLAADNQRIMPQFKDQERHIYNQFIERLSNTK